MTHGPSAATWPPPRCPTSDGCRSPPGQRASTSSSTRTTWEKCGTATEPCYSTPGGQPAVPELGPDVVSVHDHDVLERDPLGAGRLALAVEGAAAEVLLHALHH